jgi:ParB family chromosome partitioning protein
VKRKDELKDLLSIQPDVDSASDRGSDEDQADNAHSTSGVVRAIGLSLGSLKADAEIGRVLKQQVTEGRQLVELDPALIERSFLKDRLSDADDPDFEALVESIRANGQLVPILLRPHPTMSGRFQVAYGHRRLRAAELLRCKVKAILRAMTDEEVVLAQGKENSERRDLSFIERAMFAQNLEDKGFSRNVVMAALSVDKTEVAKLLSVARGIPSSVVLAIGPAPHTGRPRWTSLSRLINQPGMQKKIEGILTSESFKSLVSDRRFEMLLATLSGPQKSKLPSEHWADQNGRRLVRIERRQNHTALVFDESLEPAFGEHVADSLDKLYSEFKRMESSAGPA